MNLRALVLLPIIAVAGCQTTGGVPAVQPTLTTAQQAALLCLAATAAGQIAGAKIQADGTILCTLAQGAAIILNPATGAQTAVAPKS